MSEKSCFHESSILEKLLTFTNFDLDEQNKERSGVDTSLVLVESLRKWPSTVRRPISAITGGHKETFWYFETCVEYSRMFQTKKSTVVWKYWNNTKPKWPRTRSEKVSRFYYLFERGEGPPHWTDRGVVRSPEYNSRWWRLSGKVETWR